ncbi:MAG: HisA/HisF-related TIM barrel protein [Butyricicoccus sp.]
MGERGLRARRGRDPLTSMDKDGTKSGFDLKLTKAVVEVVGIRSSRPAAAVRRAFSEVFEKTGCDAALAASLFHYQELTVGEVKEHLQEHNIPVRR